EQASRLRLTLLPAAQVGDGAVELHLEATLLLGEGSPEMPEHGHDLPGIRVLEQRRMDLGEALPGHLAERADGMQHGAVGAADEPPGGEESPREEGGVE